MGCDFYAHAVIGVRIDGDKLLELRKTRRCHHPLPDDKDTQYCTKCGKALWFNDRVPIKGCTPVDAESLSEVEAINGIDILYLNEEDESNWAYAYIAHARTGSHRSGSCDLSGLTKFYTSDLVSGRIKLKDALEPLGLWDEDSYGLWALSYISC